jgi:transcriptional repressor of cell division inhibition gene dicB
MNIDKVLDHFGGTAEACQALGVTKGAISQWRKDGIPELRQFQIETLTKGKFKAERVNKETTA